VVTQAQCQRRAKSLLRIDARGCSGRPDRFVYGHEDTRCRACSRSAWERSSPNAGSPASKAPFIWLRAIASHGAITSALPASRRACRDASRKIWRWPNFPARSFWRGTSLVVRFVPILEVATAHSITRRHVMSTTKISGLRSIGNSTRSGWGRPLKEATQYSPAWDRDR
jgi:hypothetical protein